VKFRYEPVTSVTATPGVAAVYVPTSYEIGL